MNSDEYVSISNDLEQYHAVFYKLWNMGKPIYAEDIDTACIEYDQLGNNIAFKINKKFWGEQDDYSRRFIICHECMHVILNHGQRMNFDNADASNVAADMVINQILLTKFGFERDKIKNGKEYCWFDTVFKDLTNIPLDQNFEYYYNLLGKELEKSINGQPNNLNGIKDQPNIGFKLPDSHDHLLTDDQMNKINKELNDSLNDFEKGELEDIITKHNQQAGTTAGNTWIFVDVGKVPKKKKWETVIKNWALKSIKHDLKDKEQWARLNRRFITLNNGLILPSEMEDDDLSDEKNKINVWFFQDTSGSCSDLATRFFKAAKTLPDDKFNVRMFCFDTSVYETSLESGKLYGFGGTSFSCIEQRIQSIINKEKINYPKAIFVITDGYGDNVYPEKPERWYWFLSHDYKYYVPQESKTFMLKDFE